MLIDSEVGMQVGRVFQEIVGMFETKRWMFGVARREKRKHIHIPRHIPCPAETRVLYSSTRFNIPLLRHHYLAVDINSSP